MTGSSYDIVIIGAGPAGLMAACTAARLGVRTLLLEKLPRAGELGHPCGAAIAPHPGFVSAQRRKDGLYFPELDLLIPHSLVVGWPTTQRYVSPGRNGFMGLGDAVTPGGQLGIVPSMYTGQQAAQVAAAAIQAGDVSAEQLAPYDRLLHGPFLRGVETEGRIILGLANMTDEEMDRVCQTFSKMDLSPFFFGEVWPMVRETVRWVWRALPLILRDWKLIRRMMAGG